VTINEEIGTGAAVGTRNAREIGRRLQDTSDGIDQRNGITLREIGIDRVTGTKNKTILEIVVEIGRLVVHENTDEAQVLTESRVEALAPTKTWQNLQLLVQSRKFS
jgi:hypothetical protein